MEQHWYVDLIRILIATIDGIIYGFIPDIYNLLVDIAHVRIFSDAAIADFTGRIYTIIGIFMLFRLSFAFVTYLVNPDSLLDKEKGVQNIVKKIVIMFIMLIGCPWFFDILWNLQAVILDENVIGQFVFGDGDEFGAVNGFRYHESCEKESEAKSAGDFVAIMLFKGFYRPYTEDEYILEIDRDDAKKIIKDSDEYSDTIDYLCKPRRAAKVDQYLVSKIYNKDYNIESGFFGIGAVDIYIINYKILVTTAVGIGVLLILISFCMDVAKRVVMLSFLQIIAPIPIISYVAPGKSNIFSKWTKEVFNTWLSVFLRLLALFFGTSIIQHVGALQAIGDSTAAQNGWVQLFVIIGALMFAKSLPSIIENMFGIKTGGGFSFNPFKKISNEAFGGKALLGLGAAGVAGVAGAVTNFGTRTVQTAKNIHSAETTKDKFKAFGAGALGAAGSTIAGGFASATNAFRHTNKDGSPIRGMWTGYQESNNSRFMRDENKRKAGVKTLKDSFIYSAESLGADVARLTGNLTKGQSMQIKNQTDEAALERKKKELNERKRKEYEPYQDLKKYMGAIEGKIDDDSDVKQATQELDLAKNNPITTKDHFGREVLDLEATNRKIQDASDKLKEVKENAYKRVMETEFGKGIGQKIDEINVDDKFKQISTYADFKDSKTNVSDEEFNLSDYFARQEREINSQQQAVNEFKSSYEYTMAQAANADRRTQGVLKPGQQVSPNIGTITDNPYYSPPPPGIQGGPGPRT